MTSFSAGFFLGLSLILAIGAQNAFVLKQGLLRAHILPLVLFCAISDALLISVGVFGASYLREKIPLFAPVATYAGVLFLVAYGAKSLHSAFTKTEAMVLDTSQKTPLAAALLLCFAFTWLNPHVYLDTVVLVGLISDQYPNHKAAFALGAISASFVFFLSLGYGARLLTPLFTRPVAWKVLDFFIALVLFGIAISLLSAQFA